MAALDTSPWAGTNLLASVRAELASAEQWLAQLEMLVARAPVGIAVLDRDLRFVQVNEAFAQLDGVASEAHHGRTVREALPQHAAVVEPLLLRVLETGEPVVNVELGAVSSRRRRTALASCYPLRDRAGTLFGIGAMAVDITERKEAEDRLERHLAFQQRIIAILSHDLRNPVQAIAGAVSLLQAQGGLAQRQTETLGRIRASAARMGRMIADLLDFARVHRGEGIPVKPAPMDLFELCAQIVGECTHSYPMRHIVLETFGSGLGEWDPDRVAQVLSNVLTNALVHGSPEQPVLLRAIDLGESVSLEVHNAGSAIPSALRPTLFEPFQRSRASRGLGLGLFITSEIVRAHGGSIDVQSAEPDGTTVLMRWPRRVRAAG